MKIKVVLPIGLIMILFAGFLAACAGSGPEETVTEYLNALVNKDASSLSALSCADWEENALLELDSFQAVTVRLENATCVNIGEEDDASLVRCNGKLIATYNNEDLELDLSDRTYKVVNQGGDYLVCGYQ